MQNEDKNEDTVDSPNQIFHPQQQPLETVSPPNDLKSSVTFEPTTTQSKTPEVNELPLPVVKLPESLQNHTISQVTTSVGTKNLKKKKTVLFVLLGVCMLLGFGLLSFLLLVRTDERKPQNEKSTAITKKFNSPIGVLPPFQAESVRNGKFKLKPFVENPGEQKLTGNFFVDGDNVEFEVIQNVDKVNDLLRFLISKTEGEEGAIQYDEQIHGATRNVTFDFKDFLRYGQIYRKDALFGGFIPSIEAAKANPSLVETNKLFRLGDACDAALDDVKQHTDTRMNVVDLELVRSDAGDNKTILTINQNKLAEADASLLNFYKTCFDFTQPSIIEYESIISNLEKNPTKSPVITYWKEGEVWRLTIHAEKTENQEPMFDLEIYDINEAEGVKTGETASFAETRNIFGQAYNFCRVVPVTDEGIYSYSRSYRFIAEDQQYRYPSDFVGGYSCTTEKIAENWDEFMIIDFKDKATITIRSKADLDKQRAYHDFAYFVESFNRENKRYPNTEEIASLVKEVLEN